MNAPQRNPILNATTSTSGVHARAGFETPLHREEDEDLQVLVQRASSRPPAPPADYEEIHIPRLAPLMADDLESLLVSAPLSLPPTAAKSAALPTSVKAMIALPWTLLVVGGVTVAALWPRSAAVEATPTMAVASRPLSLPGAAANAMRPSAALAVDTALPEAALEPVVAAALAPSIASAQAPETAPAPGASLTEARSAHTVTAAPAVAATVATAIAPTVASSEPAEAVQVAEPAAPVAAQLPSVAPNGTNFDAITARIEGRDESAAAAAPEAAPALPERPSRGDVARALRAVQSAVDACTSDVGVATVRLTVSGDGTVTAASATGDYAGTSAGGCMADAVRGARFPAFSAASMTIAYPFTLH